MIEKDFPSEPDPTSGPVRFWLNGDPPIAGSLNEIREGIDIADDNIVESEFERYEYVNGATLFKYNIEQARAIIRQTRNINRAVEKAKIIAPETPEFHQYIKELYDFKVPKFV
ncbi:MAG: hypothetical protein AAB966_00190, partial [Patescibacteria group bacterium]